MRIPGLLLLAVKVFALALMMGLIQTPPAAADRGLNEAPRKSLAGFYCKKGLAPANYRGNRVCRPCGSADGQPACEKARLGPTCGNRLVERGGTCRSCGGRGELACPKIEWGYPCEGKMAPDANGVCNSCGGKDQAACRAGKAGEQCNAWLDKDRNNMCRPCGGDGQQNCPVLKGGTVCKPGLGTFDGKCYACGKKDERACPAIEVGRQCEEWTTQTDGYCKPCGERGQQACRITDKGAACKPGLKRKLNGTCDAKPEYYVQLAAMDELERIAPQIGNAALMAMTASEDDNLTRQLEDGDASAADSDLGEDNCLGDTQSWSVSATGTVNVGIGGEAEVGFVRPCKDAVRAGADWLKWFYATGHNIQLGFGAEGGLTFGFWNTDFENLRGKTHGYEFDIRQLLENATSGPLVRLKEEWEEIQKFRAGDTNDAMGVTIVVGAWFLDYDDNDPRAVENALIDWRPEPVGWSISVIYGGGWDAGFSYAKMNTRQYCSPEMKCGEGHWENSSTAVIISDQTEDSIKVSVDGDDAETYTRQDWTKRYFNGPGDQRIVFRKNYTELDYTDEDGDETRLEKRDDINPAAADDSALTRSRVTDLGSGTATSPRAGAWQMIVAGNAIRYDLARLTADRLVVKRRGADQAEQYTRTTGDTFVGPSGQSLRFVGDQTALWISADRSSTYQLSFSD